MKIRRNSIYALTILAVEMVLSCGFSSHAQARQLNVEVHSQDEIRDFIWSHDDGNGEITYEAEPVVTEPYSAGRLSNESQQYALNRLNEVRYIAGLYSDVKLNSTYTSRVQAGTLVNYVNKQLSHQPVQPYDMDEELYGMAYLGANRSNLISATGSKMSWDEAVIQCWLGDGDDINLSRVGHRRWCLNPSMGKTGFGAVTGKNGIYIGMYAVDKSYTVETASDVVWPAQNMPTEFFKAGYPWSISSDTAYADDVSVKLVRKKDGKVWNFSFDKADGFLAYNMETYGQQHCLIFLPSDVGGYYAGDEYSVQVMENKKVTLAYSVHFFDVDTFKSSTKISLSAMSGKVEIHNDRYYWNGPEIKISDPNISLDRISVVSSDESVVKAVVATSAEGVPYLYLKGISDGTATVTLSLTRDIQATFTAIVGNGKKTGVTTEKPKATQKTTEQTTQSTTNEKNTEQPTRQLKKGDIVTVGKGRYKVTDEKGKLAFTGLASTADKKKVTSFTIPDAVVVYRKQYKVTQICANALKNNTYLKSIVIGEYINKIGKNAFSGCKKITKLKVRTGRLTLKNIGAGAFKGISSKTVLKVPSGKKNVYRKIFEKKGMERGRL